MYTHTSFLRGINVGGSKRILMSQLKNLFEKIGFNNVKTYIQTGNVLFNSSNTSNNSIEVIIKEAIFNEFGFDVPVLVFQKNELLLLINNNPFLNNYNILANELYITMLFNSVSTNLIEKTANSVNEPFYYINKNIYFNCPKGYSNAKLSNTYFESKLKVIATTRNFKVINELASLMNL